MTSFIQKALNYKFKRRTFLKAGVATAAGVTIAASGNGLTEVSAEVAEKTAAQEGEWKTAPCWHNCGGRCLNKALVVDGVIVRQKTDDTHEDSADYPQQRGCVRGRSQRKQVYGADRLKYPMKRKNWEPGGGNKELRGQDEWVKITWDEAYELIATEMKRIYDAHGPRAMFATGAGDAGRLMAKMGGYIGSWGTTSWGSWRWGPEYFGMEEGFYKQSINDRMDLRNSELIVMFGMNPAWSSGGNATYHYMQAKKAGAKFVVIDPIYTDTVETFDAKWLPIRPGTDHTLLLALAHVMFTEDSPSNPLIDWDFLKRCAIGFDADHMPAGADPKQNVKDYVLGTYDGTPKSPEWASEICGIEANDIKWLARQLGYRNKVALMAAWSTGRTHNSDSMPQMFMTLGAMGGHMGLPGKMTGISCHYAAANGGPALVKAGGSGLAGVPNPLKESIAQAEMWNAILRGNYVAGKDEAKEIDIKMIYHGGNAHLQTMPGFIEGVEAHRKVDFVVAHGQFLTTNAKYADIVLPVTTEFEKVGSFMSPTNREIVINAVQVIEPLFEAKDDRDIVIGIGEKLGFTEADFYNMSKKQGLFNQFAGATVVTEDGVTWEPLVTITDADIQAWGVEGTPQQGRIALDEFIKKGVYQVERKVGDKLGYIGYQAFRQDPANNPVSSASGKLEMHCPALKEFVDGKGFTTIDPHPTYTKSIDGYEDTFSDWEKKAKGEFPYQVINPHYMRRSHTVFDNIPWLREAFPSPVYVSTEDARDKGFAHGDTVLLSSKYGKTLRQAYVTERIRPGVIGLPHGAWPEINEKDGIDRAGADNVLTGQICTGQGILAWNTTLCNMEKWTGETLEQDVNWPQRIVL